MDKNIKLNPNVGDNKNLKCSSYDEVTGNCLQTSYPCDSCNTSESWLDDKIFD